MENNGPILLIDDDEKLRELVVEYLSEYGYDIRTLSSGMKAVETIQEETPALWCLMS